MIQVLQQRSPPCGPSDERSIEALLASDDGTGGRRLLCRACGQPITTTGARIDVGGAHEHTRINPAGVVYGIGCFRVAPGCVPYGETSSYFTWFSGYSWQIALCRGCRGHLGWTFRAADDRFHGLVVERLHLEEERPSA